MPIIIVEGVDGSGKSTFIKMIEKAIPNRFKVDLQHRGPILDTVGYEYFNPLLDVKPDSFLVSDRWHVGEMIYGPLYRNESKVTGEWNIAIEALLDKLGAVKVVMKPSLDVVRSRLANRGEDYLQDHHVEEVYNFYSDYAEQHEYHVITGTTYPGLRHVAKDLVGLAILGAK